MKTSKFSAVVRRDPAGIAAQVLSRTEQGRPPVDLDKIIEDWKSVGRTVEIAFAPLEGTGYLLDQAGEFGCILVEQTSKESQRASFTIAHELGHWILHRFEEQSSKGGPPVEEAPQEQIESWCDRFATALLMPSPWIKKFAGQFERIGRPEVILGGPQLFRVSREAFYLRLEALYRIIVAELTASGKLTFWSRRAPVVDKVTWSRLSEQISSAEWKRAEQEPLCKGPLLARFSSGPRWMVLIARTRQPERDHTESISLQSS